MAVARQLGILVVDLIVRDRALVDGEQASVKLAVGKQADEHTLDEMLLAEHSLPDARFELFHRVAGPRINVGPWAAVGSGSHLLQGHLGFL